MATSSRTSACPRLHRGAIGVGRLRGFARHREAKGVAVRQMSAVQPACVEDFRDQRLPQRAHLEFIVRANVEPPFESKYRTGSAHAR